MPSNPLPETLILAGQALSSYTSPEFASYKPLWWMRRHEQVWRSRPAPKHAPHSRPPRTTPPR
ncbi:hypothetical protein M201_gp25 [Haloarcula californiae tailed virus 2]|uniref:Uncharacterized protein n=1 Tax=Haloarcula californiae tailed virus 2 TaxID=1273747 RepID=R4TMA6_9CAUD|nr:hypothetical protein M201_gp25 [Haloarcula californiae tailed virus 2]AGM11857.1 hypothetical protein HCTV2_29 [Haloarcula californiae tailed virus 2]